MKPKATKAAAFRPLPCWRVERGAEVYQSYSRARERAREVYGADGRVVASPVLVELNRKIVRRELTTNRALELARARGFDIV